MKLGQRGGAETNQTCKEQRPIKLQVIKDPPSARCVAITLVIKQDVTVTMALNGDGCTIGKQGADRQHVLRVVRKADSERRKST